jgi:hypothetical protein
MQFTGARAARSFATALLGFWCAAALVATHDGLFRAPAALADEAEDHAAELRELLKGGDEARVVAKVNALEKVTAKKVDEALLVVARANSMPGAAKSAMRVLGVHGDPSYVAWVKSRLPDKKMADEQRELMVAMLDSLPAARDALKPCLPSLSTFVDEYLKTRSDLTTRAIAAYGSVHDKAVIPALIGMLDRAENSNTGGGGGGRGSLTSPPPTMNAGGGGDDSRTHIEATKSAIIEALKSLTGADASNLQAWRMWWWKNEKTFRFPPKEPNWATITAYTDEISGLTLKRPAGTQPWAFEKCPFFGGRGRLKWQDEASLNACVDVIGYPRGDHAGAPEFAASVAETWRSADFSEFSEGYEPTVVARKIGGRAFSVLTARGVGNGSWSAWAECERRVYVATEGADAFLAIECAIRASVDEAVRNAFWANVEGSTFKPVK